MNSIEVDLKINPLKESPEAILQLPEKIAIEKGICYSVHRRVSTVGKHTSLERTGIYVTFRVATAASCNILLVWK